METKEKRMDEKIRAEVFKRDNYTCRYCGSKKEPLHADHVYPYSKGGETSAENLVTSCQSCNSSKHNHVGIFPKPIGYFEQGETHAGVILPFILLGVGFIVNGALLSQKYDGWFVSASFILGLLLSIFGLAYLMTKKWR